MKPVLFIGTRAEDVPADGEYQAMLTYGGLEDHQVRRIRLEQELLGEVDLSEYSAIILGGGPFNISDAAEQKSEVQRRVESELRDLAKQVIDKDFPFLGACYGIGTLGSLHGGVVDRTFGEPVGAIQVQLTEAGRTDPLFGGLAPTFSAFVGHKEAVRRLPSGAVHLAASATCPVQAFRLGKNVYATQFHPELDSAGLCERIDAYRTYGYFDPGDAETLKAAGRTAEISQPMKLLRRFVAQYAN
jgi:GMP synthase (glutamine-hydrolysing)